MCKCIRGIKSESYGCAECAGHEGEKFNWYAIGFIIFMALLSSAV